MFANEYQGGAHVEVLSTQGQNPLAQWKVTGPQKGVQKVYDKALKGYVFVSSGGCRLALPKDERAALGLVQPHLLLQVEVGVGTPFSVEVGLSDASATRRRIILSSSFSELKSTPLHCQVPFTGLPRECWLNLVLPLADLAAVLFKGGGAAGGAAAAAAAGAAALTAGTSFASTTSAAANMSFRTLDSLQLAGTCRLRRICTLKETPQVADLADGSGQTGASGKPLEFPAGLDHQTLVLDPRSLALVGVNAAGGSPSQTMSLGSSGGSGGGLGVVGTSTGSSRRGAGAPGTTGGASSPLPGVSSGGRPSPGAAGRAGAGAAVSAAAAAGGDDDSAIGGGTGSSGASAAVASAVPHHVGDPPTRGSSSGASGASTPTSRAGSAVPTLPPAFGATGHHSAEHGATPSRLGRTPSGGFISLNSGGTSREQLAGSASGQNSGPGSLAGSGPLPSLDGGASGSLSHGHGGLKLPPVQCANGSAASAATATAAGAAGGAHSGGGVLSPGSEDISRGDGSPFGSRRALSAQTPPRPGGSQTPPGSAGGPNGGGGASAAAGSGGAAGGGGGGGGSGKPPASSWSGSASSKRAQSGPARISTEALAQGLGETQAPTDTPTSPSLAPRQGRRTPNNSHIPPTISENETTPAHTPGASSAAGTPSVRSPARSPSRARPQQPSSVIATVTVVPTPAVGGNGGGGGGAAAAAAANAATPAPPTQTFANAGSARTSGSYGPVEPASPGLPHLRPSRAEAAPGASGSRELPPSPGASTGAGGGTNPFAQLASVLTIRGGMEASIDFGAHSVIPEGSPGSSSILSSNLRISSVIGHAHRYGNGGGGGVGSGAGGGSASGASTAPLGASADASSESEGGALSPTGGSAAATATVTVVAASTSDAVSVKVPRIRTRVLPGGGAAGGGGGSGAAPGGKGPSPPAAGVEGINGRTATAVTAQGVVPNSPSLSTRKGVASGQGPDVDTPTRAGRGGLSSAVSQNGRNSPANTPSRAGGGGRMTPMPGAGAGAGANNAGPGPSSLNPIAHKRREDSSASGRPSAAPATLAPAAGAAGGGGASTPAREGRASATAGGGGGAGAAGPKQSASASSAVCSSPARQRPAAPSSASRGPARNVAGGAAGGTSATPAEGRADRDRLPPLVAGGGRGRGAAAPRAAAAAAAAPAAVGGGGGRGKGASKPLVTAKKRPTTSNEVDVEESITLTAGMWGGFGVDEDDDMLGSRHFRSGGLGGSSGSDGDADAGMLPSTPSLRRGLGPGGGGSGNGSMVRRTSRSSSPDAPCIGAAEELPSPPNHYAHANENGLLSPPIRRTSGAVPAAQEVLPAFAGFVTNGGAAGRRRSSGTGAAQGPPAGAPRTVLDSILDEEALLAGHTRDLDQYDDWARVDQRPTPPDLLHPHRAFTPPVVPASKSLGVSIDDGGSRGRGGGSPNGGRGGASGRGGGSVPGPNGTTNRQVLRLSGAAAAAAAAARGQGVVVSGGGEAMLDLVYDPVLNCYYDGSTGQYYELKT